MAHRPVGKGVVLAAGDGDRLGGLTSRLPKALVPVLGKPLILYPLEALAQAGIRDIAVVVGHLGNEIEGAVGRKPVSCVTVEYIPNPDYWGGNAISVEVAGQWAAGEPFVLCMGDHLMQPDYVARFMDGAPCREALGVDFRPGDHHVVDEATKVQVDGAGHIRDIGKELIVWDGIDTGVFLLTESFVNAVRELCTSRGKNIEISDVIRFMLRRGQEFVTCDTSGLFWADIDTLEDIRLLEGAERWLDGR